MDELKIQFLSQILRITRKRCGLGFGHLISPDPHFSHPDSEGRVMSRHLPWNQALHVNRSSNKRFLWDAGDLMGHRPKAEAKPPGKARVIVPKGR